MSTLSLPSDLPVDLLRLIFEQAAYDSTKDAYTLLFVSRDVRNWIERLLYRSITLMGPKSKRRFDRCFDRRNDEPFFSRSVHNLRTSTPLARAVLSFTSVTHLYLRVSDDKFSAYIPDLRRLRSLRNLILDSLGLVVYIPAPPSLTHLQLCSLESYSHSVIVPFLSLCPALSHLMFYGDVDLEKGRLEETLISLQDDPSYRRIAVVSVKLNAAFIEWWMTFRERDPRLLLVNIRAPRAIDHIMDADEAMLKRFDFWDRVDEFLGMS